MLTLMRACCDQLVLGHLSYWRLWYRRVLGRRRLQRRAPRAPRALRHARARTRASGGGAAVDGGGAGLAARAGAARPGGMYIRGCGRAAGRQWTRRGTSSRTRRVRLVRGEGRDVSSQYGRGGGVVGRVRGWALTAPR
jgi:hypothetical protein